VPAERAVLIVGPVTWDHFVDGRRAAGGTVSYAARTAQAMGIRAYILTAAAGDADLSALAGHEVHVVPAPHTMTFEHRFEDGVRRLRVTAMSGRTLHPRDVPAGWPAPDILILAPLAPSDVDVDAFTALPFDDCCVTGQGLLRSLDTVGDVHDASAPTTALARALTPRSSLFLSSDEIGRWPEGALEEVACRARRVVVTRGARGADIVTCTDRRVIAPVPAEPVDTTGAGDVFAAAFILAVGEGEATAGRLAAAYAAAAVEVQGAAPLPARATIEQRLSTVQG
jgi:hypothetical protein